MIPKRANPLQSTTLKSDQLGEIRFFYQRYRRQVFLGWKPSRIARVTTTIALVVSCSLIALRASEPLFKIVFIPFGIAAVRNLWRSRKTHEPNEIVIQSDRLFLSPLPKESNPILFEEIQIYEESISHIDIYHEVISGLTKFRILRHEFIASDWDQIGPILQQRTRHHSPKAKIHNPLNPPVRKLR